MHVNVDFNNKNKVLIVYCGKAKEKKIIKILVNKKYNDSSL